jgi:hypothetical protein
MNGHNTNNGGKGSGRNHGGDVPTYMGSFFQAWTRGEWITLEFAGRAGRIAIKATEAAVLADQLLCNAALQAGGTRPVALHAVTKTPYAVPVRQALELARTLFTEACAVLTRQDASGKGARDADDERWSLTHVAAAGLPAVFGGDGPVVVDDPEDDDWIDFGEPVGCGRR